MFKQWLFNESVTFSVEDYEKPVQLNNVDDLANYLKTKLYKIPEFGTGTNLNLLSADGYETSPKGTLNFYPKGINQSKIPTILKGVEYYLDELNIKHSNWRKDKSGLFKGEDVYRIDVEIKVGKKQYVPEVNMANRMADHLLRDILNIHIKNINQSKIDARDLLIKIGNLTDYQIKKNIVEPVTQGNFIAGGMDEQRIRNNLSALEDLCRWAVNHGYQSLRLS